MKPFPTLKELKARAEKPKSDDPRAWTESDLEKLYTFAKDGMTGGEIAARMGRSEQAIYQKASNLGLPIGGRWKK